MVKKDIAKNSPVVILALAVILLFPPRVFAQAEIPEPFFMSEVGSGDAVIIGKISKGGGSRVYNGIKTNEFSLVTGGCTNYGGVAAPLDKMRVQVLSYIGDQVIIHGQSRKIDMAKLLKENPTSECIFNLSISKLYYFFIEAKKIEPVVFYELTMPKEIDWSKPLDILLKITNPLKESIDDLLVGVYPSNDAYRPFERSTDLASKDNKLIQASLMPGRSGFGRSGDCEIKLVIQGYAKKSRLDYMVLFEETIASYDNQGLLVER